MKKLSYILWIVSLLLTLTPLPSEEETPIVLDDFLQNLRNGPENDPYQHEHIWGEAGEDFWLNQKLAARKGQLSIHNYRGVDCWFWKKQFLKPGQGVSINFILPIDYANSAMGLVFAKVLPSDSSSLLSLRKIYKVFVSRETAAAAEKRENAGDRRYLLSNDFSEWITIEEGKEYTNGTLKVMRGKGNDQNIFSYEISSSLGVESRQSGILGEMQGLSQEEDVAFGLGGFEMVGIGTPKMIFSNFIFYP